MLTVAPESIHSSLWLASQLAQGNARTVPTGYPSLDKELPGGGWPISCLTELLQRQPGIGELRLLRPALVARSNRPVALLAPPHAPQALALANWGVPSAQILWVETRHTADALWAAEQILRAGTCGALIFWQSHLRNDALRRLHLAAQASDVLFFVVRPTACARDASPAPLRLTLEPASDGIRVQFVKRRGPQQESPLNVALQPSPILLYRHAAPVDLPAPVVPAPRNLPAELVH